LNGYSGEQDPWSVRQTAIYQKYDHGIQTWLFISASKKTELLVNKYIRQIAAGDKKSLSRNPFELHLSLIDASLENWRWYIKSLVERVTGHSTRVVAATVGRGKVATPIDIEIEFEDRQTLKVIEDRVAAPIDVEIRFEDRQTLKVIEDRVLDLITIFESTLDTISTLIAEYEFICYDIKDSKPDKTLHMLRDNLREVRLYQGRVKTLYKRVQGTALLVSTLVVLLSPSFNPAWTNHVTVCKLT
jgi:hypothetical protein